MVSFAGAGRGGASTSDLSFCTASTWLSLEISSSPGAGPSLWLRLELGPGKSPQAFAFRLRLDEAVCIYQMHGIQSWCFTWVRFASGFVLTLL